VCNTWNNHSRHSGHVQQYPHRTPQSRITVSVPDKGRRDVKKAVVAR
jgi:hypothetical protein